MNKQPETESTAAAAYWAAHAAESAAEARETVEQGVHIEITGEAAERAREAAERMRNGQERQRTLQDLMQEDQSPAMQALRQMRELVEATESTRREIELAQKRAPIIAVDFDGTLCENKWPEIGAAKWNTIQTLIAARAAGARLILWTNRVGSRLREAIEWCRNRELEFDAVNENLPEILAAFTTDCRKVYADIYLDDKAAQPSAAVLEQLWQTARATMNEAAQKPGEEEQG